MLRLLAIALALCLAGAASAEEPVDFVPKPFTPKPVAKPPAAKAKAVARPAWAELTAGQQKTLAPLKADWDSLEPERRRKWLGIAKRYPTMKAEEQERVQLRMQHWARLTPEQRRLARETYKQITKATPGQRGRLSEQWVEYQQLPPREREGPAPEPRRKN